MPIQHSDPFSVFELKAGKNAGKWSAVAQVPTATGQTKPKKIVRKTEKLAREAMRDWLRNNYLPPVDSLMSVASMMDRYLDRCIRIRRKKKTTDGYKKLIEHLIKPTIGHHQIKNLTAYHIEGMMATTEGAKWAINGRNLLRSAINKVARKADPKLPNVAELAEPPAYIPKMRVIPAWEEFLEILAAAPEQWQKAAWITLAQTGMRPSEVRELTWPEVYEEEDGMWIILIDRKSEMGRQPIAVPKEAAAALRATPRVGIYLFPSDRTGKPWHERTFLERWYEACDKAGKPRRGIYELRHLYGSLKAKKVPLHILRRLMRHADIRTTQQYYLHARDADLRAASEE